MLTSGWPTGLKPESRLHMLGWMLAEVPEIKNFLRDRGFIDDHNAHEFGRYFNVLQVEPVTVPQGKPWSTMTMITFKLWSEHQGFMNRHAGQAGIPLYVDEQTPQHGVHIRVSPCSPQWQRKLEAPIRVLLSCINSHPDFQTTPPSIFVLWKTRSGYIATPGPRALTHKDSYANAPHLSHC